MFRTTLLALTAAVTLAGCASESANPGGGSVDVADPAASAAAPAPAASKKPTGGLADGSFTSAAPQIKEQFGTFGGTARVTNTSDKEKTATFTYTIMKGDQQVGTLQGVSNAVGAGTTATVTLLSTDKYVAGPYKVEFQVDAEF